MLYTVHAAQYGNSSIYHNLTLMTPTCLFNGLNKCSLHVTKASCKQQKCTYICNYMITKMAMSISTQKQYLARA